MPLVQFCRERGCTTLTMGDLCLEHECLAQARLSARVGTVVERLRTPALAVALAAVAAFIGHASGRFGR